VSKQFRTKTVLGAALLLGFCLSASAAVYSPSWSSGFANSGNIPDANPTGWSDSRVVSIADASITDISVHLNISGGFNGDLYAYLSYNGVLIPLLNRVGVAASSPASSFGYSDTGFDITLTSTGNDVHFYGRNSPTFNGNGQLTGSWAVDGRNIDPQSAPGDFDSASRNTFSDLNGLNPNGTWTLFFADMSGGSQSQVVSWGLDITAVPEPANVALGIFGGLLAVGGFWRARRSAQSAKRLSAGS
jgi:subtilisin-like proprotein convertase family protein